MKQIKFTLMAIMTLVIFVAVGQDSTGGLDIDGEPGTDWTEIISYAVNALLLALSPKLIGIFKKLNQAKDLLIALAEAVEDGKLSSAEIKNIAAKGKILFSK